MITILKGLLVAVPIIIVTALLLGSFALLGFIGCFLGLPGAAIYKLGEGLVNRGHPYFYLLAFLGGLLMLPGGLIMMATHYIIPAIYKISSRFYRVISNVLDWVCFIFSWVAGKIIGTITFPFVCGFDFRKGPVFFQTFGSNLSYHNILRKRYDYEQVISNQLDVKLELLVATFCKRYDGREREIREGVNKLNMDIYNGIDRKDDISTIFNPPERPCAEEEKLLVEIEVELAPVPNTCQLTKCTFFMTSEFRNEPRAGDVYSQREQAIETMRELEFPSCDHNKPDLIPNEIIDEIEGYAYPRQSDHSS